MITSDAESPATEVHRLNAVDTWGSISGPRRRREPTEQELRALALAGAAEQVAEDVVARLRIR